MTTEKVTLVLQSVEDTLARIEALPVQDRAQVSDEWLAQLRSSPEGDPWTLGFAIVEKSSGRHVGSAAFKGPPDEEGAVEIAYGVDSEEQGRGYATDAARQLVAFAFADERVRIVRAHTLPEKNASTTILAKLGFSHLGEVIDPEDGLVWRWEIPRA